MFSSWLFVCLSVFFLLWHQSPCELSLYTSSVRKNDSFRFRNPHAVCAWWWLYFHSLVFIVSSLYAPCIAFSSPPFPSSFSCSIFCSEHAAKFFSFAQLDYVRSSCLHFFSCYFCFIFLPFAIFSPISFILLLNSMNSVHSECLFQAHHFPYDRCTRSPSGKKPKSTHAMRAVQRRRENW